MTDYYRGRRYVSDMYEPGEDDRGARDEGYYYQWCGSCGESTEHEDEQCLSCDSHPYNRGMARLRYAQSVKSYSDLEEK